MSERVDPAARLIRATQMEELRAQRDAAVAALAEARKGWPASWNAELKSLEHQRDSLAAALAEAQQALRECERNSDSPATVDRIVQKALAGREQT